MNRVFRGLSGLRFGIFCCGLLMGIKSKASEMDGYVMPSFFATMNTSSLESGTRVGGRIEFGRLAKNIALDLRYGTGVGYTDFGGAFKIFRNWEVSEELLLSLGVGALYMTSGGQLIEDTRYPFREYGVTTFVRTMFETPWNLGLLGEFGVDLVPTRIYTAPVKSTDSSFRTRFFISIGIPFSV